MKKKAPSFILRLVIITSVFLLTANLLLGFVLMSNSHSALKTLIDNRMLDIANTAADMIDGDDLASLRAEDKGTPAYQKINDALTVFQENINLNYIYAIHPEEDGTFTFSVDPTIEDPGEFGSPVTYTDALYSASLGVPAVDKEPYSDAWGSFYSAYSPVFDSEGNVAGIVAVDFSAKWYENQIRKQTKVIFINCILSILLGIALIMFSTSRMRSQIVDMTDELSEVAKAIDALTLEINPNSESINTDLSSSTGDVIDLGQRIHRMRTNLEEYRQNLSTQANSMISALSSEYRSVYYVDLDKNDGICYQTHSELDNGLQPGEHFSFLDRMHSYATQYVTESYRKDFLSFIHPGHIRTTLQKERIITLLYMVSFNGKESYEMLRMAAVRQPIDSDDHVIHAISMGFTDVDDETRAALEQSQALSDALDVAENANMAKTAFLSNMSHEIRTPMNAIIGLNRIALSDPTLSDETRDNLENIATSADHLLGIINEILDMSRIEAGKMVLKHEAFSLSDLLEQINILIGGQCREKGLEWIVTSPDTSKDAFLGDPMKLKQVLINILSNAVKYTPEGGHIRFISECTASFNKNAAFRFTVSDNGIGMSEEYLPKLFDPFSQEDNSIKNKYGSTGLGMSITKSIVDMMNGSIQVESTLGEGTTFIVTIALDLADENAIPTAVLKEPTMPAEDSANLLAANDTVTSGDSNEAPSLSGLHILLAEDMAINAQIMKKILKMQDIVVDHAENGRIALDMFQASAEGDFDAILMDMRMPEMDGLTATKAIRALDRTDAKKHPHHRAYGKRV